MAATTTQPATFTEGVRTALMIQRNQAGADLEAVVAQVRAIKTTSPAGIADVRIAPLMARGHEALRRYNKLSAALGL